MLEYDDVANDQRKVIYAQRNELLESKDISDTIASIRADVLRLIGNLIWLILGRRESLVVLTAIPVTLAETGRALKEHEAHVLGARGPRSDSRGVDAVV